MSHAKPLNITYTCSHCNATNRVNAPNKLGGRWKCGKCGNIILHRKRVFHEALIHDVRQQLELILNKLREIRFPVFAQGKINDIEQLNQKYRSKLENWMDHISYIQEEDEQQKIFESYQPDLSEIERLTILISSEIKDTRWLKDKVQGLDIFRKIVVSTSYTMKILTSILTVLGFDDVSQAIARLFEFPMLKNLE